LLVLGPGVHGSYSGLVSSVDLALTIAEIAGVAIPTAFEGKSFLQAFRSPDHLHREYIFAEQNNHASARSHTAVRSRRYLLIRNYFFDSVCASEMTQLWEDIVVANKQGTATPLQSLCYLPPPPVQFFKVDDGYYEKFNLADNPAYAEQQATLAAALDDWEAVYRKQTCKDIACAREIEAQRPPL
jgi:arylsulfatase A-like enzyme